MPRFSRPFLRLVLIMCYTGWALACTCRAAEVAAKQVTKSMTPHSCCERAAPRVPGTPQSDSKRSDQSHHCPHCNGSTAALEAAKQTTDHHPPTAASSIAVSSFQLPHLGDTQHRSSTAARP